MRAVLLAVMGVIACGGKEHDLPDAFYFDVSVPTSGDPKRLTIDGRTLLADGVPTLLHGANLRDNLTGKEPDDPDHCTTSCDGSSCTQQSVPIVTPDEADDLADRLSLNFVRLRISFEGINRNDCDPDGTNLSADLRQRIDEAVAMLAAKRIWILLEMRTSDAVANDMTFYDPGHPTPDFAAYKRAWAYLSQRYANVDYIAGYGILAEPSPDKDKRLPNTAVVGTLVAFQKALMDEVTLHDARTPIFIGPAFNYDTLGYRWDDYATAFGAYRTRLVYEVNFLMPKPWISTGKDPFDAAATYPSGASPSASELTARLLDDPVPGLARPLDDEQLFNKHRETAANFPLLMTPAFASWYLSTAVAFANKFSVPMVVDQFGAELGAGGQLAYEADVIAAAEAAGLGWSRWLYNAYQGQQQAQDIEHNPTVHDFYAAVGAGRAGP